MGSVENPEGSLVNAHFRTQLVLEVKRSSMGKTNVKRYFPDDPKKATAIFMDSLPQHIQILVQGM